MSTGALFENIDQDDLAHTLIDFYLTISAYFLSTDENTRVELSHTKLTEIGNEFLEDFPDQNVTVERVIKLYNKALDGTHKKLNDELMDYINKMNILWAFRARPSISLIKLLEETIGYKEW
jgi:hypothetical protein